jgi:DNA-binding transcriptional MerR regulator
MNRSKLASLTDIPGRTIRYYEEKGIIPVPDKRIEECEFLHLLED